MPAKATVLHTLKSETGVVYQLLHTPGSAAPWGIVVDGEIDASYDDYGDALRGWQDALSNADS